MMRPDKTLFAGLTVVLAGFLTASLAALQIAAASVHHLPGVAEDIPPAYSLLAGAATVLLGAAAIRTQSPLWAAAGAGAAIVSLGFYLVAPLLGLVALGLLLAGWNGHVRLPTHAWPDKALAASMVLFVAGIMAILHAGYVIADRLAVPAPGLAAAAGLVGGAYLLWASRQCYHVRRAWAARAGAVVAILTFSFYVAGPILGVAAMVLLRLAHRESEFQAAAPARAAPA